MQRILILIFGLFITSAATVAIAATEGERDAVDRCLGNWRKHPFKKNPPFRIIAGKVRVLGAGGEIADTAPTDKPELVLIKPNVTVLAKSTLKLMNPNGWYCLKGRVAVLGKTQIDLACKANLASSEDGATVLGGGEQNGVTVLGSSRVNRLGCSGDTGGEPPKNTND